MGNLLRRLLLGLALGIAIYAAGAIYLGLREVAHSLSTFRYVLLLPVLLLTCTNYLLRYVKWALYLRALDISVPLRLNAPIFLSGLSMVVTPGKIGELLKAYLLKQARGVPMSRTLPVVLGERITDLIALVLLLSCGISTFRQGGVLIGVIGGGVLAFLIVISSPHLSQRLLQTAATLPGLRTLGDRIDAFYASTTALFRVRPLVLATLLSIAAWGAECLGAYLIINGFPGTHVSLLTAVFIYSVTTLGGLPSPGGLGLTDGGMAALLRYLARMPPAAAGGATLLIRLSTLWFAVAVGLLGLLLFRRQASLGALDVAQEGR